MRLETYNLDGLRYLITQSVDWYPSGSTKWKDAFRSLLNQRLIRLVLDLPNRLVEQQERIAAFQVDYTTGLVDVNSSDSQVLEIDTADATWAIDGSWGGRWVRVQTAGGVEIDRRIREVWVDLATSKFRLSVDEPFPPGTGLSYRIYSQGIWMPPEFADISGMRIADAAYRNYPVDPLPVGAAERYGIYGIDPLGGSTTSSYPSHFYRGEWDKLTDPLYPCTVAASNDNWEGPEPAGTFRFMYTYVWGSDVVEGPLDINPPRLESAASGISEQIAVTHGAAGVDVSLPNIEWAMGYGVSGTVRQGHGGLKKRIYVARAAINPPGSGVQNLESAEVFYYLDEVEGDVETYTWLGVNSPVRQIPYEPSHGRLIVRLDPRPNQPMRFSLRGRLRPPILQADEDACRLPVEAVGPLICGVRAELYRKKQMFAEAAQQEAMYERAVQELMASHPDVSRRTKHRRERPYETAGTGLSERIPTPYTS